MLNDFTERNGVDVGAVDDVIVGCAPQVDGQSWKMAPNAVLGACFPETVSAAAIGH